MRNFLLLLGILLFSFGCGSAIPETEAPTISPEDLAERHFEPRGQFSYRPPVGWHLIPNFPGYRFTLVGGPEQDGMTPNITVIQDKLEGASQRVFIRRTVEQYFLRFENFREISETRFSTPEGLQPVRLEVQSLTQEGFVRQNFYFFFRDDEVLVLIGSGPASYAAANGPLFDAVAMSFRLGSESDNP